ncbi:MAG: hypothetical protein K8U57_36160 [Planctomycetes bacterium]|nr:hypothetical protein [Planctomycetota bacterium]
MARIRTIKPEFPQSESVGNVSRDARLTFILLWTIADDSGRLRGNSRMLASVLFPYDPDAGKLIDKWLGELEAQACIHRYAFAGAQYIQVLKWQQHQRVDKPSPSKIPPPPEDSRPLARIREDSCGDQGREGIKERTKEGSVRVGLDELSVDHISDWLSEKRSQGKYLTHDPHFVLEQFKDYCKSKGKTYADYIAAYRNAFEWERCQPKRAPGGSATNAERAQAATIRGLLSADPGYPG